MNPRVAIIDMGTNTFHLLVAEKGGQTPTIVFRDRVAVKIGQGGINDGKITPEAFNRAANTLKDFKAAADNLNVETILAYATSAVRSARNGKEFVDKIRETTGIQTRVINGDEEASLIYSGVSSALELGSDKSLIVDVGGGSVEFIIADKKGVAWKQSFEVGGQRLLERFHKHDPIRQDDVGNLNKYLSEILDPLFVELTKYKPTVLIGVSGTFDTLSEIYCKSRKLPYFPDDPETPLTFESFYETYDLLIARNRAQRMAIPGMIEMRVDMIVVACCLIKLVVDRHLFDSVRVSTWSLKEGALIEYLSEI